MEPGLFLSLRLAIAGRGYTRVEQGSRDLAMFEIVPLISPALRAYLTSQMLHDPVKMITQYDC